MSNTQTSSRGIGFSGLLTIVFIVLKLCHVIDWSWWWVLCPIWGVLAIALVCFILAALFEIIRQLKS